MSALTPHPSPLTSSPPLPLTPYRSPLTIINGLNLFIMQKSISWLAGFVFNLALLVTTPLPGQDTNHWDTYTKNQSRFRVISSDMLTMKTHHVGLQVDTLILENGYEGYILLEAGIRSTEKGDKSNFLELVYYINKPFPLTIVDVEVLVFDIRYPNQFIQKISGSVSNYPNGDEGKEARCQFRIGVPITEHLALVVIAKKPFKPLKKSDQKRYGVSSLKQGEWVADYSKPVFIYMPDPKAAVYHSLGIIPVGFITDEYVESDENASSENSMSQPIAMASTPATDDNEVYQNPATPAGFPGGEMASVRFLGANVKYPTLAKENGIQGMVVVEFIVEKDGSITNASIVKDIGGGCGEEAMRVIQTMPKWEPAKQNNQPVRSKVNVPVKFRLE
jgi:TonB family protein